MEAGPPELVRLANIDPLPTLSSDEVQQVEEEIMKLTKSMSGCRDDGMRAVFLCRRGAMLRKVCECVGMCACVCVCVRACVCGGGGGVCGPVCACGCVCVCVCVIFQLSWSFFNHTIQVHLFDVCIYSTLSNIL